MCVCAPAVPWRASTMCGSSYMYSYAASASATAPAHGECWSPEFELSREGEPVCSALPLLAPLAPLAACPCSWPACGWGQHHACPSTTATEARR